MDTVVMTADYKIAVVVLGGNAIIRRGQEGNIQQQFANTRKALEGVLELVRRNYRLVITHGNGPQVGNLFLMVESTRDFIPELPLGVCVADTQSQIGYMIQQSLNNHLIRAGYDSQVATIITQVLVDCRDPYLETPKKPIGPFFSEDKAREIEQTYHWKVVGDSERGYRIVVPSPEPIGIVETPVLQALLQTNAIVVAAGGGGIPVVKDPDGTYRGVDAVVEKDLTAGLLARELQADLLVFLTGVDRVAINFNTPEEETFDHLRIVEALTYLQQGQFPHSTMGPKIQAAIDFLKMTDGDVLITSVNKMVEALNGVNGTRMIR
jgi:carbamate kinase